MRITDKIRYNATRSDLNRLHNRSSKLYRELSSGKRINRPSDDPFGALQATGLATHGRQLTQYLRGIDTAKIQLFASDNALSQGVSSITEARTILLSAVSVVGDDQNHEVMADTVSQLREQLFNLSNSRVGDTYLFGGFQQTRPPYVQDPVTGKISYRGDAGQMKVEVGEGVVLETTLQGTAVWGGGSALAELSAGSGFTGEASVMGDYDGSRGNVRVTVEVINAGEPQLASYRVSYDGGATFDDNGGLGYSLAELNTTGPLGSMGVQLNLADNETAFNVGDQVELTLIDSPNEDIFALFDELELALREVDDIATVGALDYDNNGIADSQDLQNAIQAVVDENTRTAANPIQNPLVGEELEFFKKKARDDRFEEINNARLQNLLARLDKALNQVSDQQSFVGLGLNKVESAESANMFLQEQVATTKSQIEDADFMESVSEMNLVETALQAATSTTSRVLQGISLLDYLR